jgi:site-specific DNA recombinase
MPRPRRVLGYARVSSAEQALGTSLRDQQNAIERYAESRGLTVARFYVEAESAIHEKIERREQMLALMADVREGDLVLCAKLDRWSRDPEFTYGSVRKILAAGASFYAVDDRCDPSTSEGDTALGFRILFAREEHKRIKERMVGTRAILRAQGYYVEGLPPLGYRRGSPKGTRSASKNVLEIVPEEAEVVRAIFRRYVAGASMGRLAKDLDLKLDLVKDTLHRRLYLGEIQATRGGEWIKGKHEAIIDAATFTRAQAIIAERTLGGPRPRDAVAETSSWVLRDVARCAACGAKMGAAYAGPKDERRRYYYRCLAKCRAKGPRKRTAAYIPVRDVDAAFSPLMVERLTELRAELAKGDEPKPKKTAPTDLAERRAKLQRKREKYLEAFSEELMTREELRSRMAKLDAERLRLDAQEASDNAPRPLADVKVRREMLRHVKALEHAWKHAEPAQRRELTNRLALSVALAAGKAPAPKWRGVEDLLATV